MAEVKLSVVIPVYNEENRLPRTLRDVDAYLRKQDYEYEIIVVNDGSRDRTAEVTNALAREIANLRLVNNQKNRGKGYAVRQGMLEAKGAYRVFSDADNSTSITHVGRMWPEFEKGFDVVIGSRDTKGAVIAVRQPWWRRRLGDVFNLVVQLLSGLWGIWDTQCGFKGFSARAAQEIFSRAKINRWAFDVEVLVIAKKLGYQIKEVPVTWVNDRQSKVRLSGMAKMLLDVLQISMNNVMNRYSGFRTI
ncbi:MAG: glycosyltransferase family 2 protein [Candidatus Wildermuthbacteria bacterium]|nr:glycosyltransferase family 2 protein [Candidatus Wildermuthbacteria bacterium]